MLGAGSRRIALGKTASYGLFGSADDIIFRSEPGVIPKSLVVETVGMVWALGGLWDGRA